MAQAQRAAKAKKAAGPKQATYLWVGADARGSRMKGETQASSVALVKADLRRQGVKPIKVRKKPKDLFTKKKKIIPADISVFSRQLATMMTAGVPLVQAFEIVGRGHNNPSMQELVLKIKSDVEGGDSLTGALRKHPLQFDALFCNLVEAGESAGVLEIVLHRIAEYKERMEALKSKIKKALFYPMAVMVVAFIVSSIMLIFVVPQFESLFAGFGADLPAFTKMVVDLSRFMQAWWWAIIGGLVGGGMAFVQARKRSRAFQLLMDRVTLKAPIIGVIIEKACVARFARTLSTMFGAGVPLVEALESVAGATGNIVFTKAVLRIRENVATGQQLQLSMKQTELFPHMVIQMVAIGEESGALDSMLSKVADFFEAEVDNAVDGLTSLLEPLIMAVLGVLVGSLVIAMYLPIFKLGAAI